MPLTGNFDLYYLIMELVFGNLLAAFLGIAVAILIIGVLTRMSMTTNLYILSLFGVTYFTLWYGAIFMVIPFAVFLVFFIITINRFLKEAQ